MRINCENKNNNMKTKAYSKVLCTMISEKTFIVIRS